MGEIKHLGIILDGNRRYAKRLLMNPWMGHRLGFEKINELFAWCREFGIKELTLYCFSMQNFKRSRQEVDFLMNIFEKAFNDVLANEDVHKNKVKVRACGRLHLLPEKVQNAIKKAVDATKNYNDYVVNFCIAYGGREEIVDAVKKIANNVKNNKISTDKIDENTILENLYISTEPDLIIRTSGEQRTSNFLPFQSTYSEWFFPKKLWPEFTKKDLAECLEEFKKRERRHGS